MHWFIDPIKNQYADFDGRTGRKAFWMFVLVSLLLQIVVSIVEGVIGTMFIGFLFSLAILVPSLAIGARRLHDINKSGWWQLISLVPFVGVIILIVLLARKSKDEENQFGGATAVAATIPAAPSEEVSPVAEASQETPAEEATSPEPENTQQGFGN